jgi:hypothetical protein
VGNVGQLVDPSAITDNGEEQFVAGAVRAALLHGQERSADHRRVERSKTVSRMITMSDATAKIATLVAVERWSGENTRR